MLCKRSCYIKISFYFLVSTMEVLPQGSSSIQAMTIQTLGRITECIARLSQTVRALSLMDPLLHNPTTSLKNCDGVECVIQMEQLFDGINHSVKHMELLALSVEQKFQRIQGVVDEFSNGNDRLTSTGSSRKTSSCSSPRTASPDRMDNYGKLTTKWLI